MKSAPFTIRMEKISAIKGAEYNPRAFDHGRFKLIKESLAKLGWLMPAYVSNGVLLSGHQRTRAWKDLGFQEIPVVDVPGLSEETMRGLNILFNLATNDFRRGDLSEQLSADAPKISRVRHLQYPCMCYSMMDIEECMVKFGAVSYGEADGWQYTKSMLTKGVIIPLVAGSDGKLANGAKRLFAMAKAGIKEIPVVISPLPASYIEHYLNKVSMDFDVKKTYSAQMRYGSFRRLRLRRTSLGHGFSAWLRMQEYPRAEMFDHTRPENVEKLRKRFGRTFIDFGAGHLHETRMLQEIGLDVVPFEPYHVVDKDRPDRERSRAIALEFLFRLAARDTFDSVVISSVFNSVPFMEDRDKILCITAAISDKVFICTRADRDPQFLNTTGRTNFSESNFGHVQMMANYESNTIMGEIISGAPKAQKFYSLAELKEQVGRFYHNVIGWDGGGNIFVHGSGARKQSEKDLRDAVQFEFNLPYPNDESLGLAKEAVAAFKKRGLL